jgi:hypothetical protein
MKNYSCNQHRDKSETKLNEQLEQMRNKSCEQWKDESQIEHVEQLEQMKTSCKKDIDESQVVHHQRDVTTLFFQSLDVEHFISLLHICINLYRTIAGHPFL